VGGTGKQGEGRNKPSTRKLNFRFVRHKAGKLKRLAEEELGDGERHKVLRTNAARQGNPEKKFKGVGKKGGVHKEEDDGTMVKGKNLWYDIPVQKKDLGRGAQTSK